jgi:hypothetical protein
MQIKEELIITDLSKVLSSFYYENECHTDQNHTPSPSPWQGEGSLNSIENIFIVRSETYFRKNFCLTKPKESSKEKFRGYEKISENSRTELVEVALHSLRFINSVVPPKGQIGYPCSG